jgi:hypothetical protein
MWEQKMAGIRLLLESVQGRFHNLCNAPGTGLDQEPSTLLLYVLLYVTQATADILGL